MYLLLFTFMYSIYPSRLCMPHCTRLCPWLILLVSVTSHHRNTLYLSIIVARLGSSLEVDRVDELYILVVSV